MMVFRMDTHLHSVLDAFRDQMRGKVQLDQ